MDGRTVYRVRISGLLSERDGTVVAVKLKVELGLDRCERIAQLNRARLPAV